MFLLPHFDHSEFETPKLKSHATTGRHTVNRQCKTDAGPDNRTFILGASRLRYIENEHGVKVFEEKSLGSCTEFPYFLIPGTENNEAHWIMKKYIEEIKDVHANPIQIYIRGKLTTLKPKVDATQFDGAFLKKGTGKGGMFCG